MSKATNTVGYQPNWDNIDALCKEDYIRRVAHPEDAALTLYNYTPKTQFEQHWTKDTLICRGLIARDVGGHRQVIARPFPKFFNWQEFSKSHANVVKGPWQVYEKMDGSLGILYEFAPGDYRIATRGSFTSEQALKATAWIKEANLRKHYDGVTSLFEIIYPENRIVVDYDKEQLVLLGELDTSTGGLHKGHSVSIELKSHGPRFKPVMSYGVSEIIPTDQRENKEGYVLVNEQGFRVKVKHDEYVRLHKILTNTSSRTVWEYLSDPEKDFNELLDNVPDEFYEWVKSVKDDLEKQYKYLAFHALFRFDELFWTLGNRKVFAEHAKKYKHPAILFAMLDNKDYSGIIWKLIKPERVLPFANQDEIEDG